MITIQIKNEEVDLDLSINVKNEWSEIYLGEYLDMIALIQDKDNYLDEQFYMKYLEIISDQDYNTLINIPVDDVVNFNDAFSTFSKLEVPNELTDHFEIDGVLYVAKKNMTNLTVSEAIYIKTTQERSTNLAELYLGLLSIVIRPGYKKEEDGKERYFQYRLVDEDIEERREILKTKLKATIAVPLVELFTPGTKE